MLVIDKRSIKDLIDSSMQHQLYRWIGDDNRSDNRAAIFGLVCGFLAACGYLLLLAVLGVFG